MYRKYIAVGALAGIGFLIVYLIGGNFLISLAAGLILLAIGYFAILGRTKEQSAPLKLGLDQRDYQSLLKSGRSQLDRLKKYKQTLMGDELREDVAVVISYCDKIFQSVEESPGNYNTIKDVVEVYLPSLEKIIQRYIETKRLNLQGGKAKEYTSKTRSFMKELSDVFSDILNRVHDDDIFEAIVEIDAMKVIMQSSGYLELYKLRGEVGEGEKDEK